MDVKDEVSLFNGYSFSSSKSTELQKCIHCVPPMLHTLAKIHL